MSECSSVYFLSTIACSISKCLSEDELTILSADLVTLGGLLDSIATRQTVCNNSGDKSSEQISDVHDVSDVS